jgi:HlyD family secretion protein
MHHPPGAALRIIPTVTDIMGAPARRRGLRLAVWVLALLLAAILLRLTLLRPARVPVTVVRAEQGPVEETVSNSKAGTVRSRLRAELSPELPGRVAELPAPKGSRVERGQVLLRLVDAELRAQVRLHASARDAARASRAETCRSAEQAASELRRHIALAEKDVISPELVERLRSSRDSLAAACEAARARALQAEAALSTAQIALEKSVLRAPFPGVVAEVTAEIGEWIVPSSPGLPIPPVVVLYAPHEIYVSAPMDEVDVGRVRVGAPARITMDAYPGRSFPARVARVGAYVLDVEEQNRTFEVEAEFLDKTFASGLLPGISADVEVILQVHSGVLRIPSEALLEGDRVLRVRDGRLESRALEVGLRNWQFAEVLSGLSPGEEVVVSLDRPEVKEGARVTVERTPPT